MKVLVTIAQLVVLSSLVMMIMYLFNIERQRRILKRQSKIYLAVSDTMTDTDLWDSLVQRGFTADAIWKETQIIAGEEFFVFNLGNRIRRSRLCFAHESFLANQKSKEFEKQIAKIELEENYER